MRRSTVQAHPFCKWMTMANLHTAYNFQSKQNLLPVWCVALQFRCIHFANGWQWQTCYFFMVCEKIQHRPELFEINVVTCNAIALLFGIEHYEKWLWGDFLGLNIMKNGYEVTFRNQTLQKMARMRMVSLLMCQSLASMLSSQ